MWITCARCSMAFKGPGGRRSGEEGTRVDRVPQFSTLLGLRRLPCRLPGPLVMPGVAGPGRGRSIRPGAATLLPPRGLRAAGPRSGDVQVREYCSSRGRVGILGDYHFFHRQSGDSRMMTRLG